MQREKDRGCRRASAKDLLGVDKQPGEEAPKKGAIGVKQDVESEAGRGASTCANTCITTGFQILTSVRISTLQGAQRSGPLGTERQNQQRQSLFMRNKAKGPA